MVNNIPTGPTGAMPQHVEGKKEQKTAQMQGGQQIKAGINGLMKALENFAHNFMQFVSKNYTLQAKINRADYTKFKGLAEKFKGDIISKKVRAEDEPQILQNLNKVQELCTKLLPKATGPNLKRDVRQLLDDINSLKKLIPLNNRIEAGEALAKGQTVRKGKGDVKKIQVPEGLEDALVQGTANKQASVAKVAKVKADAQAKIQELQKAQDERVGKKLGSLEGQVKEMQGKVEFFQPKTHERILVQGLERDLTALKSTLAQLQKNETPASKERFAQVGKDLEQLEAAIKVKSDAAEKAEQEKPKPEVKPPVQPVVNAAEAARAKKLHDRKVAGELFTAIMKKAEPVVTPALAQGTGKINKAINVIGRGYISQYKLESSKENTDLREILLKAGQHTNPKVNNFREDNPKAFGKMLETGLKLIETGYKNAKVKIPADLQAQVDDLRAMFKTLA